MGAVGARLNRVLLTDVALLLAAVALYAHGDVDSTVISIAVGNLLSSVAPKGAAVPTAAAPNP